MRLARLDGIRAVAVVLVIFLHHFMGERTGWVGVDLFFVLSGYLITGILIRSKRQHHYWRIFYIKRAARILPPLALLFIFATLFTHHLSAIGVVGYVLFLGNVTNLTHYAQAPFVALWSLAIEEHFYFFWPFFTRYLKLRTLVWILLSLIVVEPFARMIAVWLGCSPMAVYYLTPFRLDGLACGGMLALAEVTGYGKVFVQRWGILLAFSLWAGLIYIELTVPSFNRENASLLFNGFGYSLAAWASMATIGSIAWNADSVASKALALPWIAAIGRISYGMYLYHGVVLGTTRHLFHVPAGAGGINKTQALILIDLPLTIFVSWVSFRFLETPILHWSHRKTKADEPSQPHNFS